MVAELQTKSVVSSIIRRASLLNSGIILLIARWIQSFWKIGNFWIINQRQHQISRASAAMVTSPGAARRARIRSSSGNIVCCSVDGCSADLSKCREYHKRHKVCEIHSKTPVVVVGGQEQRFCQQCSRFHALSEFDEGKRSCRKRLDGHNRRRRKPHLSTLNTGTLLATNHQGTRFSLHQQIRPAAAMPNTNWVNFSEPDCRTLNPHSLPLQSPFLQQTEVAINADRAFSLLSSSSQSPHINPNPMMYAADKIPIGQPLQQNDSVGLLYPCFHSSNCCASMTGMSCLPPMEGASAGSNLVSGANGANLHCQDTFQGSGSKLSSFEGTYEAHTIHWQW